MEKILRFLFDYQKIEGDAELSSVIDDTHKRYDRKGFRVVSLTDDSLGGVSAAGEYVQGQPGFSGQLGKPRVEEPFARDFRDDNDNNDSNK